MKILLASGVNVFIEVGFGMEIACCVCEVRIQREDTECDVNTTYIIRSSVSEFYSGIRNSSIKEYGVNLGYSKTCLQ